MKVIFEYAKPESSNIKTFYFRPIKPVDYVAGQFTEIYLPHKASDERGQKRWFTLSSSPTDQLLSITTKFSQRSSSFKESLQQLDPGTELKLAEPMGDFILPKDKTVPLIFVAGGIGITPMHSMIKWLQDVNQHRDITLLYTVNTEEDLVFKELLDASKIMTHYIVSKPSPTWTGLHGHLSTERIIELTQPTAKHLIYISGPEPMVESLRDDLAAQGIKKSHIVGDYFPGYPAP